MTGENCCSRCWSGGWTTSSSGSGFAPSRGAARQLVRHGHFTVNGRNVDIPSFQVRVGDEISVRAKSRKLPSSSGSLEARKGRDCLSWLELDSES